MPLPKTYYAGTASIENGSTALTGTGTAWVGAVKPDDVFRVQGYSVRIASVEENGAATLAEPWPGTTLDADPYEIAITYDGPEFQLRLRQLLEQMQLTHGIQPDAWVDELSGRDTFDDEDEGFVVLVLDADGNGRTAYYRMGGGGSGDWSGPAWLTGAKGDTGNIDSSNATVTDIIKITQAAYDVLDPPDEATLYIIIDEE